MLEADCEIAEIVLAFKNNKIIELLKGRGECIASSDFPGVDKINEKINNFKKDTEKYERMSNVCYAYIVLRQEAGHDAAINYSSNSYYERK